MRTRNVGGTADVITEVNNLIEPEPAATPDEPVQRVQLQRGITQGVPVRVSSRVLRSEAESPRPEVTKAAVVEYREKANGAVIHRSFLAK